MMRRLAGLLAVLLAVTSHPVGRERCPKGEQRIFTDACVAKCKKGTVPVLGGGCTAAPRLLKAEAMDGVAGIPEEYRRSYDRMGEADQMINRSFTVQFILEADGTITRAEVVGAGDVELREGLLQRVKDRVYEPATVDGKPVAVYLTSPFVF